MLKMILMESIYHRAYASCTARPPSLGDPIDPMESIVSSPWIYIQAPTESVRIDWLIEFANGKGSKQMPFFLLPSVRTVVSLRLTTCELRRCDTPVWGLLFSPSISPEEASHHTGNETRDHTWPPIAHVYPPYTQLARSRLHKLVERCSHTFAWGTEAEDSFERSSTIN